MGGSSDTRPFGNAILDGYVLWLPVVDVYHSQSYLFSSVDLDIEGGSPSHYTAFVNKLREYYAGADKSYVSLVYLEILRVLGLISYHGSYYVFAAPQWLVRHS